MLTQTIASRVSQDLNDLGMVFFQEGDILDSIQDGYFEVVLITQCIEKFANLPFINGAVYYDMIASVPDYFKTLAIFNYATNRWPESKDISVFDKFRFDWELCAGTPWFFHVQNYRYLAMFPHYPTAAGPSPSSFDVLYKASADVLTLNSTPQLPDEYCTLLELYAKADLCEIEGKLNLAAEFWAQYDAMMNRFKLEVADRMKGDKYMQYNPQDFSTVGY